MVNVKKALLGGAFLLSGLFTAATSADPCAPPSPGEPVQVEHVFDGDTLRLADGRKVRLIGINTPELGRDGAPDQPLAASARNAARRFVAEARTLSLHTEKDPQDHYGRTLAHLYNGRGQNLEAELLRQGLGFSLSFPPNLALRDCFNTAEAQAQAAGLGVWSLPAYRPVRASHLGPEDGGFRRVLGRVSTTGKTRGGPYLELDDRLFVRVRQRHMQYFERHDFAHLQDRLVEVRGWVVPRQLSAKEKARGYRPFMLELRHPDALHLRPD
ncbi:thermonuclease family protein [Motiliproteus sp. SC1-56]|uniref:thermonuclease family protein n=1 Tax=Motiliproteus sp. SC1-56 TaxID=2799565 RepID=UPI001A8D3237|nr:thermonuclease family protein [Motiliproteus sp. SC1-56]